MFCFSHAFSLFPPISNAHFFYLWDIGRWNSVIYYFVYHYLGHRNRYRHRLIWLNMLGICSKQCMVRPVAEAVMQLVIECQNWQKCQSLAPCATQLMHENGPVYFYTGLYHNGVARNHPVCVCENERRKICPWEILLHRNW